MTRKQLMFTSLSAVLLATCSAGPLIVRAEAPDRVLVQIQTDSFPRTMFVWQETDSGKSVAYFEGEMSDRFPRDRRIILPSDFVLFDSAITGPSFNAVRFPKGRYTVSFIENAEHAYEKQFEIR